MLNKYISQFLEYLEIEKNRSQATIKNYSFYLRRFSAWAKNPSFQKITLSLVRQYRLWLVRLQDRKGRSLKKSTQNYHLIALRSFLKYLAKMDIKTLAAEKIELAKMPERSVEFLEGEDLEKFLEAPLQETNNKKQETENYSIIQLRDKAILETLFATGLRVSELANLKRDEINLKKDEFTVRGKGAKPRLVFLSDQAKYWLKKYLDSRQDLNPALFIRHDRAAKRQDQSTKKQKTITLTPRSIQRLIEKYVKIAGITKHVSPHTLRHSFSTDLLQSGADLRAVQALLGHTSITTTQIYTHITDQHLREVHKAFHGRRRKR